jgi:hypothetical protein
MLNVKDVGRKKFEENEELTSIAKILGLERGIPILPGCSSA